MTFAQKLLIRSHPSFLIQLHLFSLPPSTFHSGFHISLLPYLSAPLPPLNLCAVSAGISPGRVDRPFFIPLSFHSVECPICLQNAPTHCASSTSCWIVSNEADWETEYLKTLYPLHPIILGLATTKRGSNLQIWSRQRSPRFYSGFTIQIKSVDALSLSFYPRTDL